MADFKQTEVYGTSWQRCFNVNISNPRNAQPLVRLDQELIANVGGKEFSQMVESITFPFDPAILIQLRNPNTGETTGATMTGAQVYVALYSLYIQKAIELEQAQAQP